MNSIAICIPTLKRPDGLDRLLNSLSELTFHKQTPARIEICVVDNDPAMTAEGVIEKWKGLIKWPIKYDVENTPGIPFVRNRLIRMSYNSDFIAFIDDDEVASTQWLDELLSTQVKYNADVVMGPVDPVYQVQPPAWILKGEFHASGRFKDGLTESGLITWNVLIRRSLFEKHNLGFDERMALTGGTDVLMGKMLKQVGIDFYWSSNALVKEINPPERCRIKWLLRRRFRGGTTLVLINRYSRCRYFRLKSLKEALTKAIFGLFKLFAAIYQGKHVAIKGIGYIIQSIGIITCLIGYHFKEYKNIHEK